MSEQKLHCLLRNLCPKLYYPITRCLMTLIKKKLATMLQNPLNNSNKRCTKAHAWKGGPRRVGGDGNKPYPYFYVGRGPYFYHGRAFEDNLAMHAPNLAEKSPKILWTSKIKFSCLPSPQSISRNSWSPIAIQILDLANPWDISFFRLADTS